MKIPRSVLNIMIRDQYVSKEAVLNANDKMQLYIFKKDTQLLVDCLRTPIFFKHIRPKTFDYILRKGFIHANSKIGDTFVLFLVRDVRQMSILMRHGADLTKRDSHRRTVLFHFERMDMTQLYLDYCDLIQFEEPHVDIFGKTPLFYARRSGIAKLLLDAGFNVDHKTTLKLTLLDHFHHFSYATLQLYIAHGAKIPEEVFDDTIGLDERVWPLEHVALLRSKGTIFKLNYTNLNFSPASTLVIEYLCINQPDFVNHLMKCNVSAHIPIYLRHGGRNDMVDLSALSRFKEADLNAMKAEGFHLRDISTRGIQRVVVCEMLSSQLSMWQVSVFRFFELNFMVELDGKVCIFKKWHEQLEEVKDFLLKKRLVDLSYKRHGMSMLELSKEL